MRMAAQMPHAKMASAMTPMTASEVLVSARPATVPAPSAAVVSFCDVDGVTAGVLDRDAVLLPDSEMDGVHVRLLVPDRVSVRVGVVDAV